MDAQVKGTKIAGPDTEKAKALQAALAQIEKQFGKGTIMRLGEGEVIEDIQVISTGSLGLDLALGEAGGDGLEVGIQGGGNVAHGLLQAAQDLARGLPIGLDVLPVEDGHPLADAVKHEHGNAQDVVGLVLHPAIGTEQHAQAEHDGGEEQDPAGVFSL